MSFVSYKFFLFFPLVTLLYFLFPYKYRYLLLLAASGVFYMAFIPAYIFILAFLIFIDYIAGILIESAKGRKRKQFLVFSIISNIGYLFIFKYFDFINANVGALFHFFYLNYSVPHLHIILPVGLSFHTFQSMSYTIEVYYGRQKAERHLGTYALYVMFYPQLVAGPIERPWNLIHQFYEKHDFDYKRVTDGLKLMLWGFFKKIVIANRLAIVVDAVYNNPSGFTAGALILATYCFAFQIYCDFSGYSDIAIGAAQVMGFRLRNNFNRPYFSKSITEFWRRWHISLSSWFKDYLYIPLGGKRVAKPRWHANLLFVFLISGLWHGANWTFVVWGLLHGFCVIFSVIAANTVRKVINISGIYKFPGFLKCIQVFTTFNLVSLLWIFFRANSLNDAFYIISHIFSGIRYSVNVSSIQNAGAELQLHTLDVTVLISTVCLMECVHLLQRGNNIRELLAHKPAWLRWMIYYAAVLGIIFLGIFHNKEFIYFQF